MPKDSPPIGGCYTVHERQFGSISAEEPAAIGSGIDRRGSLPPAGLTGRTRHRRSLFGRMILQVEVVYRLPGYGRPQPNRNRSYAASKWRDATFDDLSELDGLGRPRGASLG